MSDRVNNAREIMENSDSEPEELRDALETLIMHTEAIESGLSEILQMKHPPLTDDWRVWIKDVVEHIQSLMGDNIISGGLASETGDAIPFGSGYVSDEHLAKRQAREAHDNLELTTQKRIS